MSRAVSLYGSMIHESGVWGPGGLGETLLNFVFGCSSLEGKGNLKKHSEHQGKKTAFFHTPRRTFVL